MKILPILSFLFFHRLKQTHDLVASSSKQNEPNRSASKEKEPEAWGSNQNGSDVST